MTIPISSVVTASVSVGAKFPARKGFGTLNIVTDEAGVIGIAERVRSYASASAVAADWPSTSKVVKAANAYFSQQPTPTSLKVSTRYPTAQAAQLRSGSSDTFFDDLSGISDGTFALAIDGTSVNFNGLDFTDETDLEGVASVLQVALRSPSSGGYVNSTCVYDGSRFLMNTGSTGASSTISFMTPVSPASGTDISSLLQMRQGEATKLDGVDAETITASLDAIENVDPSWYGLAFTSEVRDLVTINGENAVVAASDWCQARVKVFFNTSNDADVLDSVTSNDIASILSDKGNDRTYTQYSSRGDQYPAISAAARAFTVNFSQPNSTITLKFKQQPTISVESITQSQLAALASKDANVYIDIGGVSMITEGVMAGGRFFDEVHGIDWLTDAVQNNVFGFLAGRPTKVPYTDKGTSALMQQVIRALDEAVANGLIAPGETIAGKFLPLGYEVVPVDVADVPQADKESRNYNGLSFTVIGAGAIHGVQINGIFER